MIPSFFATVAPLVLFSPLLLLKIPVLFDIYKMFAIIAAASMITFLFFLPILMIFFASAFNLCCLSMNKICDETDYNMTEQSAESIFFIPSGTCTTSKAIAYGHSMSSHRMIMAPPTPLEDSTVMARKKRRNERYAAISDLNENGDTKVFYN